MRINGDLVLINKHTDSIFSILLHPYSFGNFNSESELFENVGSNGKKYVVVNGYLFDTELNEYVLLKDGRNIFCEETIEDTLTLLFLGCNSFIYQYPEDPNFILKYTTSNFDSIVVPELRNYCLFHESCTKENYYTIYKFKKIISYQSLLSLESFSDFFIRFRNFIVGIVKMKEYKVFNNDIKAYNIGIDENGNFVFIDLEFMVHYSQELISGNNISLKFPKGLDKSLRLHNYKLSNNTEDLSYYDDKDSEYLDRHISDDTFILFKYNFTNEVIHPDDDLIYDYLCIYQLIDTLISMCEGLKVSNDTYDFHYFLDHCLNYERYGFITSEEVLELYDRLILNM